MLQKNLIRASPVGVSWRNTRSEMKHTRIATIAGQNTISVILMSLGIACGYADAPKTLALMGFII